MALTQGELKKREAAKKLKRMVAYLKRHGVMKQADMAVKFNCGKALAAQAQREAGVGTCYSKKPSEHALDATMYRPNGRNLLCEAWV